MAYQDDQDTIDRLSAEYEADVLEYPMVRMTVPSGTSWDFMASIVTYAPPGQYVGISESTYGTFIRLTDLPNRMILIWETTRSTP